MEILTRDFGKIEVSENDIINFEEKIFGFEEYSGKYIIIYDDDFNGEYAWLQSADESDLCFIMANSALLSDSYTPKCPKETEKTIGSGNYEYWLIMVVKEDIKESTVNLKSPIIINIDNRKAMQVILEENYPIRYKIFESGKEQE
ncbi:MAG: flagellar assembly protein FliW [Clostridium sp.]|nr:flagellar assembly protein FliW [Clostridium sp.]MCM1547794.1 flagellar assembly protein FliW [Ruminococcus sp.]